MFAQRCSPRSGIILVPSENWMMISSRYEHIKYETQDRNVNRAECQSLSMEYCSCMRCTQWDLPYPCYRCIQSLQDVLHLAPLVGGQAVPMMRHDHSHAGSLNAGSSPSPKGVRLQRRLHWVHLYTGDQPWVFWAFLFTMVVVARKKR